MNKDALIEKIKKKAKQDEKYRRDPRFLETMGFLTAKGLLRTNLEILRQPNRRLRIDDVLWAGQNVEPRILEVLPAAVLRLGKHFDFDPIRHKELAQVIRLLREPAPKGEDFFGIPYEKVKVWLDFPLLDKRVKILRRKNNEIWYCRPWFYCFTTY